MAQNNGFWNEDSTGFSLENSEDIRDVQVYSSEGNRFSEEFMEFLYSPDFSIVIHTHNSIENVKENFVSLFESIADYEEGRIQVIVLVNGSSDGTYEFLEENFDGIDIIKKDNFVDIPLILNEGVEKAKYPLVLIMEDDVEVTLGFMRPLLEFISDEDVFAVVPRILNTKKREEVESIHLLKCEEGLSLIQIPDGNFPEPVYIPGLVRTMSLFKKEIFDALGGFDLLFSPFYLEDLDLGYRGWKRGYKVVYVRSSTVRHLHWDPYQRLFQQDEEYIRRKNRTIFVEKNIKDKSLCFSFKERFIKRAMSVLGVDKDVIFRRVVEFLDKNKKKIKEYRKQEIKEAYYNDLDLIQLFSTHPDNRLGLK